MKEITNSTIDENIYVISNQNNYDWLMESKEQLEKGMTSIAKSLDSDELC